MSEGFTHEYVMQVPDENTQLSLPGFSSIHSQVPYCVDCGVVQLCAGNLYRCDGCLAASRGYLLHDPTTPTLLDEFRAFQRQWDAGKVEPMMSRASEEEKKSPEYPCLFD